MTEFDTKRSIATGSTPAIAGAALDAHVAATNSGDGYVDAISRIDTDPQYSGQGKQGLIAKLHAERQAKIDAIEAVLKPEFSAIAEYERALRKDSGIDTPVESGRALLIISSHQRRDRSGQLGIVREADSETARALLQAPRVLNLLPDSSREALEERLLAGVGDGSRLAELNARREALGRAQYAIDSARVWLSKKARIQPDLRTRIQRAASRS